MTLFFAIFSIALLTAVVAFVLHNHWREHHGENHF